MTRTEALELLANAPCRTDRPAAINRGLTQRQALDIMLAAIQEVPDGKHLNDLTEKNVRRVAAGRNRL